jgi:hypothetical protein
MSRRPAITPTDASKPLPANPAWSYSPPTVSRDGRVVWLDAMTLANVTRDYRATGIHVIGEAPVEPAKKGRGKR